MNIIWDAVAQKDWDLAHGALAGPLQQDWAYGATMRVLGVPVLRALIEHRGQRVGLAQWVLRSFGPVGALALCSRGPLWLADLAPEEKAEAYHALRKTLPVRGLRLMLVTPEEEAQTSHGLKSYKRVMTGYSTVLLDLAAPLDQIRARLDGKWRNRLVAAESSPLSVHRIGTNPGQYRWLLDQEQDQRLHKGLSGLPLAFYEPFVQSRRQPSECVLSLRADLGRDRVAAMMFLIHGQAATYQLGWSNEQGRDLNAHNLLLWRAVTELSARGVRVLDLGGVNTARSAGLSRFKLGTGGRVHRLAGTYLA